MEISNFRVVSGQTGEHHTLLLHQIGFIYFCTFTRNLCSCSFPRILSVECFLSNHNLLMWYIFSFFAPQATFYSPEEPSPRVLPFNP